MMPGHDGLWLAGEMQREHPQTAVIVATAYTELLGGEAPQPPIADFLIKPFQRERFALAVDRGRQWRKQALEEVHWHARAVDRAARSRRADRPCPRRCASPAGATEVDALTRAAAPSGCRTSPRTASASPATRTRWRASWTSIARSAPTSTSRRGFTTSASWRCPRRSISKPSPLTAGEMAIMRRHVDIGAEILDATRSLAFAAPAVRASHEWFGGGGYPDEHRRHAIPFVSRIIAVADAYDAMTQDRAYRMRLDSSDAVAEILRCTPAQFDPEIVAAFLAVLGRH